MKIVLKEKSKTGDKNSSIKIKRWTGVSDVHHKNRQKIDCNQLSLGRWHNMMITW